MFKTLWKAAWHITEKNVKIEKKSVNEMDRNSKTTEYI